MATVRDELRKLGYSTSEMLVYQRLGPRSRAVIYNWCPKVDLTQCLRTFHAQRQRPDPIEVDGEFIPQPLPSVYQSADGDEEFAKWLVRNHRQRKNAKPI